MIHQSTFDTVRTASLRDVSRIAALLTNLIRSIQTLGIDIEREEERTGARDIFDPAYSMLARALAARRDNLRATVAGLEALVASGHHEAPPTVPADLPDERQSGTAHGSVIKTIRRRSRAVRSSAHWTTWEA